MDVDFYGDGGGRIPLYDMADLIEITIERMKRKDPEAVVFQGLD